MSHTYPAFLIDLTLHTLMPSRLKQLLLLLLMLLVLAVFTFTLWHVFADAYKTALGTGLCMGVLALFAYTEFKHVAYQSPMHLYQFDLQQWRLNKRPLELLTAHYSAMGCAITLSFRSGSDTLTIVIWRDTVSATSWRNLCVLTRLMRRKMV